MADSLDIDSIAELPELRFCRDFPDVGLKGRFMEVVRGIGVSNVFNPSFYEGSAVSVFAFRAIPDGSQDLSWVDIELTDAVTGESFRISDFAGGPVLVQGFAVW